MTAILFIISTFSLVIISITMLARANDLRWRKGAKWNIRLIGFILTGCAPIGMIGVNMIEGVSPYDVVFHVGLACVFMTTPYLPPWWPWIKGEEEANATN